jgi:hypothetical protein
MQDIQNIPNPDVNSPEANEDLGSHEGLQPGRESNEDIERPRDDEAIPVPPDRQPTVPIEDPPGTNDPPVGDVDDSPKIIADNE